MIAAAGIPTPRPIFAEVDRAEGLSVDAATEADGEAEAEANVAVAPVEVDVMTMVEVPPAALVESAVLVESSEVMLKYTVVSLASSAPVT